MRFVLLEMVVERGVFGRERTLVPSLKGMHVERPPGCWTSGYGSRMDGVVGIELEACEVSKDVRFAGMIGIS
jgi:hypothetical protein